MGQLPAHLALAALSSAAAAATDRIAPEPRPTINQWFGRAVNTGANRLLRLSEYHIMNVTKDLVKSIH